MDDVEATPIYRHVGKLEEPRTLHKNQDLHMEQKATRPGSHCKQPTLAKGDPITGSLASKAKSLEHNSTNGLLKELGSYKCMTGIF